MEEGPDMSDTSQGEGWWQASDLKWYPPETHPSYRPPTPPRPEPPRPQPPVFESPSGPAQTPWPTPAPASPQYPPPPADAVATRRQLAAYAIAAGALLLVVGSFLPWVKLTTKLFTGISATRSGVDLDSRGWASVGLGLAMAAVAWQFFGATKAGKRAPVVVALLLSVAAVGFTVYEWIDIDNAVDEATAGLPSTDGLPDDFGINVGSLFNITQGIGLYTIGLGGLAGVAGAIAYKQPAKS
jgi:hypothetical protein